ncbi:MAG: hypothetical protein Ta2B_08070 [Termitinemataceae bacterium]|nr:MAG: hypothetical protein Ta2B_08070 [Termitinemataceae bacterium]
MAKLKKSPAGAQHCKGNNFTNSSVAHFDKAVKDTVSETKGGAV